MRYINPRFTYLLTYLFAAERRAAAPGCGAAAAGRPALSIDIFCVYGASQQTRRTQLLRLTDGTD